MPWKKGLGIACIVLLAGVLLFNGIIMLISPERWFALPSWLSLRGSVHRRKLSSRWGRLEIRALGFVFLAFLGIVTGVALNGPHSSGATIMRWLTWHPSNRAAELVLLMIPIVAGFVAGVLMLLKPAWWIERFLRPQLDELKDSDRFRGVGDVQKPLIVAIRLLSIIPLAASFWFAWVIVDTFWSG